MTKAFKMPDGTVVRMDESGMPDEMPADWEEVAIEETGDARFMGTAEASGESPPKAAAKKTTTSK